MNMNELRIGNYYWIGYAGKCGKITGFIPKSTNYEIQKGYSLTGYLIDGCEKLIGWEYEPEPILLTAEWLIKFGFTNDNYSKECFHRKYNIQGRFLVFSNKTPVAIANNVEYPFYFMFDGLITPLHFVHELQNVFQSITREELPLLE